MDYTIALGVTSYLSNEVEYIPWAAALSGMDYLNNMLKRSPAYGPFKKYMRNLVDPLYNRSGYYSQSDEQPLDIFLRKLAIKWSCNLGNLDCNEKVNTDFHSWMENPDANRYVSPF